MDTLSEIYAAATEPLLSVTLTVTASPTPITVGLGTIIALALCHILYKKAKELRVVHNG